MATYAEDVSAEDTVSRLAAILRASPAGLIYQLIRDVKGQPAKDAPYARDLRELDDDYFVRRASELAYLWLIDAAAQHMDALDSVLSAASARRHGPRPLLRSIVEHSARSSWLMEVGIGAESRAVRAALVDADSAHAMLKAADASGENAAISDAQARSKRETARITQVFGEDAVSKTERRVKSVAGMDYPGLTAAVEDMTRRHSRAAAGQSFYRLHSTLMHPTAASASAFATRTSEGGIVFPDFDLRYLFHAVRSVVWAWRVAVDEFLAYHGWLAPELDTWWAHAELVFTTTTLPNGQP